MSCKQAEKDTGSQTGRLKEDVGSLDAVSDVHEALRITVVYHPRPPVKRYGLALPTPHPKAIANR